MVDLFSLFLALVEAVVVCAHYQDAEVYGEVANVNVQDELLRDARNAYRGPGFSSVLHAGVCVDVVQQDLDVLGLQFSYLLWVSEDTNRVH